MTGPRQPTGGQPTGGQPAGARIGLMATDLDRTLIFSANSAERDVDGLVLVERYNGNPLSYMHPETIEALRAAILRHVVVPVTTRTVAQYRRVNLPFSHRYAVTNNGGTIVVDGAPDPGWAATMAAGLAGSASLREVLAFVSSDAAGTPWLGSLRTADDLFCYAVVDLATFPVDTQARWEAWARPRGWNVSRQGRKVYWMPDPITKGAALIEVHRRLLAEGELGIGAPLVASGDGQLDVSMLLVADAAIRPRHGELEENGFRSPTVEVTRSSGVAASIELVRWLDATADTLAPAGRSDPAPRTAPAST